MHWNACTLMKRQTSVTSCVYNGVFMCLCLSVCPAFRCRQRTDANSFIALYDRLPSHTQILLIGRVRVPFPRLFSTIIPCSIVPLRQLYVPVVACQYVAIRLLSNYSQFRSIAMAVRLKILL